MRVDLQGLFGNPAVANESLGSRLRFEPQAQTLPRRLAITDSNIAHILDFQQASVEECIFHCIVWIQDPKVIMDIGASDVFRVRSDDATDTDGLVARVR